MKILVGVISFIWQLLIFLALSKVLTGLNLNSGEGIFSVLGAVLGLILFSVPSFLGLKYVFTSKKEQKTV